MELSKAVGRMRGHTSTLDRDVYVWEQGSPLPWSIVVLRKCSEQHGGDGGSGRREAL